MGSKIGSNRPSGAVVIDLTAYRRRLLERQAHPVLYLSSNGRHLETFTSLPFLQVEDIRSVRALWRAWYDRPPAVVLIEGDLDWADPVDLVGELGELSAVPTVLVGGERRRMDPDLLKRAFAAGLHDTLFDPMLPDEIEETLGILLKLTRPARELP